MHRTVLIALFFVLVALALAPVAAHAEVIDYDPRNEEPPEILSPDELALYDTLRRGGSVPGIASSASPDGQFMLTSVRGVPTKLDLDSRELTPIPNDIFDSSSLRVVSSLSWQSDSEAVFASLDTSERPYTYGKTIIDFAHPVAGGEVTVTVKTTPFELPEIEGYQLRLYGGSLVHTPDGAWHVIGYATPTGSDVLLAEPPARYEVQTDEARENRVLLGVEDAGDVVLQTETKIVLVNIDTGEATEAGTVPQGTSLGTAITSFSHRPGSYTVSFVAQRSFSCSGQVVRGRSCRGGGNPTGSFLVQEALGEIPPAENGLLQSSWLHLVDLQSGDETVVENGDHPSARFSGTLWSADGTLLLVSSAVPAQLEGRTYPTYSYPNDTMFHVFDPDGTYLRPWDTPVTVRGGSIEPIDGTRFLVMTPANVNRHVYVVDAAASASAPTAVFTGDGVLYSWELASDLFVYVRGDVTLPGELYLGEVLDVEGTTEALTNVNAGLGATSNIAFKRIEYRTSAGYDVQGVYVYPKDWTFPLDEPKPVVVWQQGGPGGQMYNVWGTSVESPYSMLPNFGIPVFVVNGSGRLSNGPQFYSDMADGRNYGQRDILDVKEGVDFLISEGIADPEAVGVTGCSYGGYFALQSMVEFPDLYKAGNAQCSLNDIFYEYNFGWSYFLGYLMGRSTTQDPAEYVRDSPYYRASQIKNPLLVFHGTNDFLPFEHMVNIHDQVANNGVPARMLRAYGEGHGFGRANSQKYGAQLQIDWFRRYLGGGGTVLDNLIWRDQPRLPRSISLLGVER